MPRGPANLNANPNVGTEMVSFGEVGGSEHPIPRLKENLFPAVLTARALEKIKTVVFNMATATKSPVERTIAPADNGMTAAQPLPAGKTVTFLDKAGKIFSDLFTAIKNRFSESFNEKTMTRKFDEIFDDLQVPLTMGGKDRFKSISEEIKTLKGNIESVQNSQEFQDLCTCYKGAEGSLKRALVQAFNGNPPARI